MMYWDEFQGYCMPVIIQKLFDAHGRDIDFLDVYSSECLDRDFEYQSQLEALELICDFDSTEDEENYGYDYFISDQKIREFYKLCFEYNRFTAVNEILKKFNIKADKIFTFNSYCYDVTLPEKEEQCLNCIKLSIDPEFAMYFELLEAILETQEYMKIALPELKFVIWQELYKEQCLIKRIPQTITKEAA